ncbi:MAG: DUF5916 domain-containing protein, partial [Lutibacter sp.]|nr:DUF5916 domain-containing protein [Lutibacter sp.]
MKIRTRFYSAVCATVVYFLCNQVHAQEAFPSAMVPYTDQQISIDGVEDEAAWGNVTESTGFWQSFPTDSLPAKEQTSFKILVDDANLYLLVKAYSVSEDYIVPSLRRDYDGYVNDNVTFLFDTYNDQTNAFMFGVNPYGVQRESLISNGGNDYRNMDSSWDAKWEVKTRQYLGYYLSEIRIPFHSIRFLEGTNQWRFNMFRYNSHTGEYTVWSRIPQHQKLIGLAFTGFLDFERPLGQSKTPLSLIPYTNALAANDYENDTEIRSLSVGGDAKIALTNGLQLDLTFNPDFSQVEVDDQVINLTRFEVTLPEKRQFFIENSDLFSNFGTGYDIRPFFSRRIGVAKDADGETIQNKILAGMRLSGKINERLRVGLLNMQTESDVDQEIAANNNTVFTLQQQLFSRSNVKLLFINRQATGSYDFLAAEDRYNRLLGADYNLASKDNRWTGRFFGYQTFSPQGGRDNAAAGASIRHNTRKHSYHLGSVYIGEDYQADLGYLKRTDLFKLSAGYTYKIWPKKGSINNILL